MYRRLATFFFCLFSFFRAIDVCVLDASMIDNTLILCFFRCTCFAELLEFNFCSLAWFFFCERLLCDDGRKF